MRQFWKPFVVIADLEEEMVPISEIEVLLPHEVHEVELDLVQDVRVRITLKQELARRGGA